MNSGKGGFFITLFCVLPYRFSKILCAILINMSLEHRQLPQFHPDRKEHINNTTFIQFPGQGSQFVGMGERLYHQFPIAKKIYDDADKILGYKISEISFQDPHGV